MQTLTYINNDGGSISFKDSGKIILEHLDFNEVPITQNFTRGLMQDGVTKTSQTVESRQITASCCILATDEAERFSIRRKIGEVLNPSLSSSGYLVYNNGIRDYKINCSIASSILFGETFANRSFQRFDVEFFCPDPYFVDLFESNWRFLEVTPKFRFPLFIRQRGLMFSSLAGGRINIKNKGDAHAPLKITIFGPCLNPSVTNVSTGGSLNINYDLRASEQIEITTHFGNKRITLVDLEGKQTNIMHLLDVNKPTSFFSLVPGNNILEFSADIGKDIGRMEVSFSPRYLII